MTLSAQLPLRCWAEIDLAALERNLKLIRAALPAQMRYVAVVKADAYGHGLPQVATRLMHAGADLLAVANLAEAAALRELSPDFPILLLGATLPDEDRFLAELQLSATVSTLEEVRRFEDAAVAAGQPLAVHLKIDTGMSRLGVRFEQAPELYRAIREARGLRLAGVFTHFATADEDPEFTAEQRTLFLRTLSRFVGFDPSQVMIHADNSAGLETSSVGASLFNAVRIGLLQYGVLPRARSLLARVRTEPVFSFHARVGLTKDLPAGAGVSYGRTHRLRRASRVAVITAGYGDGLPRAASDRGTVLIHGHRCPVLGRVCMDQTIVDITDVRSDVRSGDPVVLIGQQSDSAISLAEFSAAAETIPWETLTSVTKRVPRFYRTSLGL